MIEFKKNKYALLLIDGEHKPSVVQAAIQSILESASIKALLLIGGIEKLPDDPDYGFPLERVKKRSLVQAMLEAAKKYQVNIILDLSDEPVLSAEMRFKLINHALVNGYDYAGSDFYFAAPQTLTLPVPTLSIIGTGKRVGKTAISNYVARFLKQKFAHKKIMIMAMGRGGPLSPEIARGSSGINLKELIWRAEQGQHAASDFLEDAILAGVDTIASVRCGSGMFGKPFFANTNQGMKLAEHAHPHFLILEGSGASVPQIKADKTILIIPAATTRSKLSFASEPYRILCADYVVLTNCEAPFTTPNKLAQLKKVIRNIKPSINITATIFRPVPVESINGRKIIFFTTAPHKIHATLMAYLQDKYNTCVLAVVGSLSDRKKLEGDLKKEAVAAADTFLIEIKASAINTVALFAKMNNKKVIFCDNQPSTLMGEFPLDSALSELIKEIIADG